MAQNDEKMRQDLARKQAETEMEVEREQVRSNAKMDQAAIDIAAKRVQQKVCEKRLAEEIRDGIHNALRTMR